MTVTASPERRRYAMLLFGEMTKMFAELPCETNRNDEYWPPMGVITTPDDVDIGRAPYDDCAGCKSEPLPELDEFDD